MTSSTNLYWNCISASLQDHGRDVEETSVAVPKSLSSPLFSSARASLLSLLTSAFENKVVYASPANRSLAKTPKDFYMPSYEDVELRTKDGKLIHAWLIKRPKDPKNSPTIIHFHGNACNISHMLYDALGMFQKVRANILLVDYRGYGLSHGTPSQEGLMLDAEAALEYLLLRRDVVDQRRVFLFGRSLGGAVALALCARHKSQVRGVIVENTFTSMDSLVKQLSPAFSQLITRMTTNKWDTMTIIGEVTKPILFLSGRADEIVPCEMMTALYRAATASVGKELAAFPKGKHNSTCLSRGYYETIKRFTDRVSETKPVVTPEDGGVVVVGGGGGGAWRGAGASRGLGAGAEGNGGAGDDANDGEIASTLSKLKETMASPPKHIAAASVRGPRGTGEASDHLGDDDIALDG